MILCIAHKINPISFILALLKLGFSSLTFLVMICTIQRQDHQIRHSTSQAHSPALMLQYVPYFTTAMEVKRKQDRKKSQPLLVISHQAKTPWNASNKTTQIPFNHCAFQNTTGTDTIMKQQKETHKRNGWGDMELIRWVGG